MKISTDLSIKNLATRTTRFEVADSVVQGLRLVIQPSGARSWILRFRQGGKQHKLTLGTFEKLKLADARAAAREMLRTVAAGRNPAHEKKEARAKIVSEKAELFAEVYEEYAKRYLDKKLKPSTAAEVKRIFEKNIKPVLGKFKLRDITKTHIINLLDDVADNGAPVLANRVLSHLINFFRFCIGRDYLLVSPTTGVTKPTTEKTRERVLSDDEIRWFWRATEHEKTRVIDDESKLNSPFGGLLQLLLLTLARRDEVGAMTEAELDSNERKWTIPAERAKNEKPIEIRLARPSLAILKSMPRVANNEDYVFCTNGKTPVSGFSRTKRRIDRQMLVYAREEASKAGLDPSKVTIPDWTIHDLRRTAASNMARLGISLPVVERCLNHIGDSGRGIKKVYQRYDFQPEMDAAFERWAEALESIVNRKPAKVLSFRSRA